MRKRVELYGKQADFVDCPDRFTAMIAGTGAGKTYAGAVKASLACMRPGIGLVVAPTYRMLADVVLRTMRGLLEDRMFLRKSEFIGEVGGAEILFRSAEDPNRLRGPNCSWGWL